MKPDTDNVSGGLSRRQLLASAAAWAAIPNPEHSMFAYVGTYTGPGSNGKGIYLFRFNLKTGVLTQVKLVSEIPSPGWLAIHPNGKYLYAANEISRFNGAKTGSITALSIDRSTGDLTQLNVVSSQGAGPAHLSVDPQGQFVFVANYGGGSIAVFPIQPNGSLGELADVHVNTGSVGSKKPTNAPPGSFAFSGHDSPHAHMIEADPAGRFVFSTDLGQDRIYRWILNRQTGKLTPNDPPFVSAPPGDGPRHFVFHPNGRFFYSLQEEASTLTAYDYSASNGSLAVRQTLSTLPAKFAGTSFTSELRISRDGKFIYAANRLADSIAIFSVSASGGLTRMDEVSTHGDYPRSFTLDPTGKFLVSCNQRSDALTTYRVEAKGSKLAFTGEYTPVGSPAIIVFLP
jgi:6-phosphogluconolactonase (cycloisomerase 2 family)